MGLTNFHYTLNNLHLPQLSPNRFGSAARIGLTESRMTAKTLAELSGCQPVGDSVIPEISLPVPRSLGAVEVIFTPESSHAFEIRRVESRSELQQSDVRHLDEVGC